MAWKTSVCFGNVDVLFSFLRCVLSFHAEICMGTKFSRWCWDLLQTRYTHLLIFLSLESSGACVLLLFLFNLSCFWELLFGYSWRIWLVLEAKIPMSLFAFSWRLSIWVNCSLDRGLCLVRWQAGYLLSAVVWVNGSDACWGLVFFMPVSQRLAPAYNVIYCMFSHNSHLQCTSWSEIYHHVLLQVMYFLASLLTHLKKNASEPHKPTFKQYCRPQIAMWFVF